MTAIPEIDPPANVLVLGSPLDGSDETICSELLAHDDSSDQNVVFVTLTQSPDERIAFWTEHVSQQLPSKVKLISGGDFTRSAAVEDVDGVGFNESAVSFEGIEDLGNLTKLGVAITNTLSEWSEDPNRTDLCFHSISTLLQYAQPNQLFRFFHATTGMVQRTGGIGHFHLDPAAHDEQVVHTFRQLFDVVLDYRELDGLPTAPTSEESNSGPSFMATPSEPTTSGEQRQLAIDEDQSPHAVVAESIASMTGEDPAHIEAVLARWISPEAFDGLLRPTSESGPENVQLNFEIEGFKVIVDKKKVLVRE